jgi:hypothetical protein
LKSIDNSTESEKSIVQQNLEPLKAEQGDSLNYKHGNRQNYARKASIAKLKGKGRG